MSGSESSQPSSSKNIFDVLIVGAGIAGLSCARTLAGQGLRVCVVEAADRIGGRIHTVVAGDQMVELGAEFVHGRPPELLALIEEAHLTLCERGGTSLSFNGHSLEEEPDAESDRVDPLEDLRSVRGPDLSFREYLSTSSLPKDQQTSVLGYVEGFNAADASEISVLSLGAQQTAEDEIDGDRIAHIREGYTRLPSFLAERLRAVGGELRLELPVTAIRWGVGRVALETPAGELIASRAVITLPLGVLQAQSVHIVPEPAPIFKAASMMRMGPVCRFTMVFRDRFWEVLPPQPAMQSLSFFFDFDELPPVWWTAHPEDARTLTGWVGGPRSEHLLGKSEAELADLGCRALARLFSLPLAEVHAQLEHCRSYNWSSDPSFLGSYSYVGVGGIDASALMAEPVEHTLFFAGEHTDTSGHWGTVHGALRSGLRAARQILST